MFRLTVLLLGILSFPAALQAKTAYADVRLTHLSPIAEDRIWTRTKQVTPRYPVALARRGIAGCGVFQLDVNKDGKADNITLLSSVPENGIYKEAKKLIKSWRWQNISALPDKTETKIIRLDFCMGGSDVREAQERCARQSQLACSTS